ncbi:hypothetical protein J4217_00855 [Candidatus Pacearchaeota archaeon]|nr:hypothetical protein [Candidatus Pacearchaeota archaeon]
MTKILIASKYEKVEGSLIFLAGSIQGAKNWQEEAIKIISELKNLKINVASPRRNVSVEGDFTDEMYNEQVDWETFHLRRAAKKGVIMFWLAKESEHFHNRAYAQTSRFELAEWKVRHAKENVKLVIGIEKGFTGARYIRRRFSQDCPDVPILDSLTETCKKAVELALES